ncbi:MAG: tRNA (adenosine(37)-N6)-threonylcarbamoyltransferase complex ATPase subunit type 1 TsaE [Gemmatimonadota bacterium]|nr:tRNA (adenosine(37)-N6)-threonylcarbamoyltransferase complex ATPase subunit type 1 TsaE [Gemmatimonadota bacterium]
MKPTAETGEDRAPTGDAEASVCADRGITHLTEDELVAWGRRIGAAVTVPIFIGLIGPLGAGKSVLARAVARGAGVEGALPSPTFNIVFRYPASGRRQSGSPRRDRRRVRGRRRVGGRGAGNGAAVVHADLFRIASVQELAAIGWEDMVADRRAIVLVEWCRRAGDELPQDRWEVTLDFVDDDARRAVRVERVGEPSPLPGFRVAREALE